MTTQLSASTTQGIGPRIVGDVGGTNARWGRQAGPGAPITDVRVYPCAAFPSILSVIETYVQETGGQAPVAASFGIACPVLGDEVRMTNHSWVFSIQQLRQALALEHLVVINDFTAQALAIPEVPAQDCVQVGPGQAVARSPIAVIGPGTGLGVSGLLPAPGERWVPLMGEGGHVTLSASTPREAAVVESLHSIWGHASAERAVSGQGLENLYRVVCQLGHQAPQPWSAADISQHALAGDNAQCVEALTLFCSFLGTVAGNLALTLGARGGVYLVGGILPRLGAAFAQSPFRERFEAKGRYRDFLQQVPTWVVTSATSPALAGAARALDDLR